MKFKKDCTCGCNDPCVTVNPHDAIIKNLQIRIAALETALGTNGATNLSSRIKLTKDPSNDSLYILTVDGIIVGSILTRTNSGLDSYLRDEITNMILNILANKDYITDERLSQILRSYLTESDLALYAKKSDLNLYPSKVELNNTLNGYVKANLLATINGKSLINGGNNILIEGGNGTVDPALDAYSPRAVANSAITAEFARKADKSEIPTKVSQLQNDSLYINAETLNNTLDGLVTSSDLRDALSAYTVTSKFATINNHVITDGGNIVIEGGTSLDTELKPYLIFSYAYSLYSTTTNLQTAPADCNSDVAWSPNIPMQNEDSRIYLWQKIQYFAVVNNRYEEPTSTYKLIDKSGNVFDVDAMFVAYAFTRAADGVNLSSLAVRGGTYNNPVPSPNVSNGVTYTWTDGIPSGSETSVVWITRRSFKSNETAPDTGFVWDAPSKFTDIPGEREIYYWNPTGSQGTYDNYSIIVPHRNTYDSESAVEADNPGWVDEPASQAIAELTVWTAVTHYKNGQWSDWKYLRIKGEKGEDGKNFILSGAGIKGTVNPISSGASISEEREGLWYLFYDEDNTPLIEVEDGESMPSKGTMYYYTEGAWTSKNSNVDGVVEGLGVNIEGYLYCYDGSDDWVYVGKWEAAQGEDGKSAFIHIKYAELVVGDHIENVNYEATIPNIGRLRFTETSGEYTGEEPGTYIGLKADLNSADDTNIINYTWSKHTGEDGWGYEYIFTITSTNEAPLCPFNSLIPAGELGNLPSSKPQEYYNDDFVPDLSLWPDGNTWHDDFVDPTVDNPYSWKCWRKRKDDGIWGDFRGASLVPYRAARDGAFLEVITLYFLIPNATLISRTSNNLYFPSKLSVSAKKVIGNTTTTFSDALIRYILDDNDTSVSYTGEITLGNSFNNYHSITFELYNLSGVITNVTVPIVDSAFGVNGKSTYVQVSPATIYYDVNQDMTLLVSEIDTTINASLYADGVKVSSMGTSNISIDPANGTSTEAYNTVTDVWPINVRLNNLSAIPSTYTITLKLNLNSNVTGVGYITLLPRVENLHYELTVNTPVVALNVTPSNNNSGKVINEVSLDLSFTLTKNGVVQNNPTIVCKSPVSTDKITISNSLISIQEDVALTNIPGFVLYEAKVNGVTVAVCSVIILCSQRGYAGEMGKSGAMVYAAGVWQDGGFYMSTPKMTPLVLCPDSNGDEHYYFLDIPSDIEIVDTFQDIEARGEVNIFDLINGKFYLVVSGVNYNNNSLPNAILRCVIENNTVSWETIGSLDVTEFKLWSTANSKPGNSAIGNIVWHEVSQYEAIYAKMVFANFAKFGNAVFYGKYLFSEYGTYREEQVTYSDAYTYNGTTEQVIDNVITTNGNEYQFKFKTGVEPAFVPNLYFDLSDGSGHFAGGNISWDANGNLNILSTVSGELYTTINCANRTNNPGNWEWTTNTNIKSGISSYTLKLYKLGSYYLANRISSDMQVILDLTSVPFSPNDSLGITIKDSKGAVDVPQWLMTEPSLVNEFFDHEEYLGFDGCSVNRQYFLIIRNGYDSELGLYHNAWDLIPIKVANNALINKGKHVFCTNLGNSIDVTVMPEASYLMAFCGGEIKLTSSGTSYLINDSKALLSMYLMASGQSANCGYYSNELNKWINDSSLVNHISVYSFGEHIYLLFSDNSYNYMWPMLKTTPTVTAKLNVSATSNFNLINNPKHSRSAEFIGILDLDTFQSAMNGDTSANNTIRNYWGTLVYRVSGNPIVNIYGVSEPLMHSSTGLPEGFIYCHSTNTNNLTSKLKNLANKFVYLTLIADDGMVSWNIWTEIYQDDINSNDYMLHGNPQLYTNFIITPGNPGNPTNDSGSSNLYYEYREVKTLLVNP